MKDLKKMVAILFTMLAVFVCVSCDSSDEPGSSSSHDYYSAYVSGNPSYYWVIDMDHKSGAGFDGKFVIKAWDNKGKQIKEYGSFSGKYQIKNNTVYVTWDHQSMNTMWSISASSITMIGSSNPAELSGYTFRAGAPDFEK